MDLTPFEVAVMEKLLSGDHPSLIMLRAQVGVVNVSSREFTGVGMYVHFRLPPGVESAPLEGQRILRGVVAELEDLRYGVDCLLYVQDGRLDCLEIVTFGEPWPRQINKFRLCFVPGRRDLSILHGPKA